ncbi:LPXTG cell wall anchor domain-containing protein [Lysinibacter sp. HNR]|uniref:LPXTG cell wall anchor domain-containing protein n=1 Tax=Lysinibacter sp. HNR TaxID=3031408 RepID=UPI002435E732|nr:LPXTG cell wall anchor domain-containing protein [Lysinibacter sp. HNR]WGD38306.1 LPXTG cell wall anchor domain-containing protein [Lysinibacter sp. HNR]
MTRARENINRNHLRRQLKLGKPPSEKLASLRAVFISFLSLVFLAAGSITLSSPAQAATILGPGFGFDGGRSIFGGYIAPDGSIAYCLEWGKPGPTNPAWATTNQGPASSFNGWGELEISRINYVVTTWGQTADPVQAAAVAVTIWSRHAQSQGAQVSDFSDSHPYVFQALSDPNIRARVFELRDMMTRAADNYTPVPMQPHGLLSVEPHDAGHDRGWVSVKDLAPGTRGTLVLDGAVFDATGSPSITGAESGSRYSITYMPTDEQLSTVSTTLTGTFTMPGRPGDHINLWVTPPRGQTIGTPSSALEDYRFSLTVTGEPRDLRFSPVVQTQVPTVIVERGERFTDTLYPSLAPGSLPWRRLSSGNYLPITLWCQAYGPLLSPPTQSSLPDPDAPVFGKKILMSTEESPAEPWKIPVDVSFDGVAEQTGYYTYVCGVDAHQQQDARSVQALPTDYFYQHDYGLVEETQVTPMRVRFDTQLDAAMVAPGTQVSDAIIPRTESGGWLESGDGIIPVTLEGTAYWSESQPERSQTAPDGTEVVGTYSMTLLGLQEVLSSPLTTPYRVGWVTVQWCIPSELQLESYQDLIEDWCDDYGVPAETVKLEWPQVVTQATTEALVSQEISDVATVSGIMPTNPDLLLNLSFEAFLQEGNGVKTSGHPPRCEPDNRVFRTEQEPLAVGSTGDYVSAPYRTQKAGTYFWVETLTWLDKRTQETGVISVGECGTPSEATIVSSPPVLATTGEDALSFLVTGGMMIVTGIGFVVFMRRKSLRKSR